MSAALALCENRIPQAELLLREHLKKYPTDVAAIRMFAEVAGRLGRYQDAENLLVRCLELAPGFNAARYNYAMALYRQNKSVAALQQIDILTASEPRNSGYRNLKAVVLANIGDYQESLEIYADVLAKHPDQSKNLDELRPRACRPRAGSRTASRPTAAASHWPRRWARRITVWPTSRPFGSTRREVQAHARAPRERRPSPNEDRAHFHFAIGKALEDSESYAESFEHYAARQRAAAGPGRLGPPTRRRRLRAASKALFNEEFFAAREGFGAPAADPIFIVGLPRAGSTWWSRSSPATRAWKARWNCRTSWRWRRSWADKRDRRPGIVVPGVLANLERRGVPRARRAVHRANAHSAQDRQALLHRQNAQ